MEKTFNYEIRIIAEVKHVESSWVVYVSSIDDEGEKSGVMMLIFDRIPSKDDILSKIKNSIRLSAED